jgi:hypothetical protein
MPETTAITGREFRGYEDATTTEAPKTAQRHPPHAKRQLPHTKRQNVTNPIPPSGLPPQALLYLTQINTVLFSIDLVNVGSNLNESCQDLRNGVNNTQAASIAINTTQAADFVCAAYAANLTYIDPSIVQVFATALYAVALAANFSGTTNTTNLCNSIDMNILTISMFGVDGHGVQSYVCNGNNATFGTGTSSTSLPSTVTVTTSGWINGTSFGTAPLATGSLATSVSTSTGGSSLPFGNYTGTRTRSYTGPRTNSHSETRTRSGSGFRQPSSTGLPRSILSGTDAQSGSGYDHSTATDVPGRSYSRVTGFPTGLGSGYTQPTGTGVSGRPYGNFTGFRTGSGSSYAPTSATGGLDNPFGLQPSSLEPLSSARLPPSPSTLHHYPAVSPSATPTAFYGYGFEG